jgi:hypothetical protein
MVRVHHFLAVARVVKFCSCKWRLPLLRIVNLVAPDFGCERLPTPELSTTSPANDVCPETDAVDRVLIVL